MSGLSATHPALAEQALELEASIPVLRCWAGEAMVRRIFGPLGYELSVETLLLDEQYPEWGNRGYFAATLKRRVRLADMLTRLYVLLPAIYGDKHYFVSDDEVAKLVANSTPSFSTTSSESGH